MKMHSRKLLRALGLGKGAVGEVRLAKSKKYPNNVAIKIMYPRPPENVSKFLSQELSILRAVQHAHIIAVHDIHEMSNGQVFIVMEAAIRDLQEKISALGCIPPYQAKIWFSQLIFTVEYLHQKDIVHRDLKCKNVLLTDNDRVKLADFGLGGFYKGLSEMYFCTPAYAAPEVLSKKPYDPKQSDMWSLGVILYNMVIGHLPFNSANCDVLIKAQQEPIEFPDDITLEEPCQSLIVDMLKQDPSAQPTATEVAKHPWLQSIPERVTPKDESSLKEKTQDIQQQQQVSTEEDEEEHDEDYVHFSTESTSRDVLASIMETYERINAHIQRSKTKPSERDISPPQQTGEEVLPSHPIDSVKPELENDGSIAGKGKSGPSIEAAEVEFGWGPFFTAFKRITKVYITAPIVRACQGLRQT